MGERVISMEKLCKRTFAAVVVFGVINAVAVKVWGERVNCIKLIERTDKYKLCQEEEGFWMSGLGGNWRYTEGKFEGTKGVGDMLVVGYMVDSTERHMILYKGKFLAELGTDPYLLVNFDDMGDYFNIR